MARHIVCVFDRTVGPVSICWDYVSIFINKNSNYNKINQITTKFSFSLHVYTSLFSLVLVPESAPLFIVLAFIFYSYILYFL